jgi:hypothetical protein
MKKYEWYIPQDVYDEILNEICLFNEQFEQGKVGLTIDDKVLLFYNSIFNLFLSCKDASLILFYAYIQKKLLNI